jgi:hypothetical protein
MKRIIVSEFVTLDGVMEHLGGPRRVHTEAGAFNSSMKNMRNTNAMSCLLATLFSWGA